MEKTEYQALFALFTLPLSPTFSTSSPFPAYLTDFLTSHRKLIIPKTYTTPSDLYNQSPSLFLFSYTSPQTEHNIGDTNTPTLVPQHTDIPAYRPLAPFDDQSHIISQHNITNHSRGSPIFTSHIISLPSRSSYPSPLIYYHSLLSLLPLLDLILHSLLIPNDILPPRPLSLSSHLISRSYSPLILNDLT